MKISLNAIFFASAQRALSRYEARQARARPVSSTRMAGEPTLKPVAR